MCSSDDFFTTKIQNYYYWVEAYKHFSGFQSTLCQTKHQKNHVTDRCTGSIRAKEFSLPLIKESCEHNNKSKRQKIFAMWKLEKGNLFYNLHSFFTLGVFFFFFSFSGICLAVFSNSSVILFTSMAYIYTRINVFLVSYKVYLYIVTQSLN